MSFIVGTTVRLRSGGPRMTIQAIDGDAVTCVWFDKATLRRAEFATGMLEDPARLDDLLESLKNERGGTSRDASGMGDDR
jgi:uncharacterized protein YodC (DUF2158 family)